MSDAADRSLPPSALAMVRTYFGAQHPLCRTMGIDIVSIAGGRVEVTMPCTPGMQDARGALHRGAMVTLLDTACGLSLFSALESLRPVATIDMRVDYHRPLPPGTGIRGVAECLNLTETVAYITGRAYAQDDSTTPLAVVTGTFAINTQGPTFEGFIPSTLLEPRT